MSSPRAKGLMLRTTMKKNSSDDGDAPKLNAFNYVKLSLL